MSSNEMKRISLLKISNNSNKNKSMSPMNQVLQHSQTNNKLDNKVDQDTKKYFESMREEGDFAMQHHCHDFGGEKKMLNFYNILKNFVNKQEKEVITQKTQMKIDSYQAKAKARVGFLNTLNRVSTKINDNMDT